ncbi:MAG: ankyrin repeat domain-containing protein [Hyphomicrobiaceae bacterium]|nr:ankyrin repeat domain-containing protein [Hyphomicrobiaceae bacterium]MCC0023189.1 ankyrin repeat domain-containing protein [Hyphomicrobiaceae bacterium]
MRWLPGLLIVLIIVPVAGCSQTRPQKEPPIVTAVIQNDVTVVRQYLAEGGDPDYVTSEGDPLIYLATGARGGLAVTEALIVAGANLSAVNADGRPPLHNAAGWCNVAIVDMLIRAGASLTQTGKGGESLEDSVCARPPDRRQEVLDMIAKAR